MESQDGNRKPRLPFSPLSPAEIEKRRKAMEGFIGIWKDRTDLPDTDEYMRNLQNSDERMKYLFPEMYE